MEQPASSGKAYDYSNILNIRYTPDAASRCRGWFTDAGAWYGFTLPQQERWVNGFCGPFHLDMNKRQWLSDALVKVRFDGESPDVVYTPDSASYFPGELYMSSFSETGRIEQRLIFVDKSTALLTCSSDQETSFRFSGEVLPDDVICTTDKNRVLLISPSGEGIALTFKPGMGILASEKGYETLTLTPGKLDIVISFF